MEEDDRERDIGYGWTVLKDDEIPDYDVGYVVYLPTATLLIFLEEKEKYSIFETKSWASRISDPKRCNFRRKRCFSFRSVILLDS
jgi:hypothetical protein